MDRDPPAMEPPAFPNNLRVGLGFRVAHAIVALMAIGFSAFGAAVALGLPEKVSAQTRLIGFAFAVFGLVAVITMQVPRLVLHVDRIELISLLGLSQRVLPLSSLRAYRISAGEGSPTILLVGQDDKVVATLRPHMYEAPELLSGYLSARLRFDTSRPPRTASFGQTRPSRGSDCQQLKVGDPVRGQRIRGALGLSVVTVRPR